MGVQKTVVFLAIVLFLAGCSTATQSGEPAEGQITLPGEPFGLDQDVVIDLPPASEQTQRLEDEVTQAIAEATPADFCADVNQLFEYQQNFRALIDNDPGAQPYTDEVAAAVHEIVARATSLRLRSAEIQSIAGLEYTSTEVNMFDMFAINEQWVRQANFLPGPIQIPFEPEGVDSWGADVEVRLPAWVAVHCPSTSFGGFVTPSFADLPGPRREARIVRADFDVCLAAQRTLIAHRWVHDRIEAHLGGDPYALVDAEAYYRTVKQLAGDELRPAMSDDDLQHATFPAGSLSGNSFTLEILRRDEVLDIDLRERRYSSVEVVVDEERALVDELANRCADLDPALIALDETFRLFDLAVEVRHGPRLPDDVDQDTLCRFLGFRFDARVEFRNAVDEQDVELADSWFEVAFGRDHQSAGSWPAGFDEDWFRAQRWRELELWHRLAHAAPIERNSGHEAQVEALVAWTSTNCPDVTTGLDLLPVHEVFPET